MHAHTRRPLIIVVAWARRVAVSRDSPVVTSTPVLRGCAFAWLQRSDALSPQWRARIHSNDQAHCRRERETPPPVMRPAGGRGAQRARRFPPVLLRGPLRKG